MVVLRPYTTSSGECQARNTSLVSVLRDGQVCKAAMTATIMSAPGSQAHRKRFRTLELPKQQQQPPRKYDS